MTDPLIEQLVQNLKPAKSLQAIRLWAHCSMCLAIMIAVILAVMGLRADYLHALHSGVMIWKPGLFLAAWGGSLLLIADISRPTGSIKSWHFLPILGAGGVLLYQLMRQFGALSPSTVISTLYDPAGAPFCLGVVSLGGAAALFVAWKFWFLKTASPHPVRLGGLAGFSAGCLAAAAYALHCDRDSALYVLVYYGAPIATLSILGLYLGKKSLKW